MNNGGIEDILIGGGYNTKKKKGKGIKILFFFLMLILIAFLGAYWYFMNQTVSAKELFIQNISKNNVKEFLQGNVYTNIYDRLLAENSEINSCINLTTEVENTELKDIDFTKFILEISNLNDVQNSKTYSEATLNYSGNEVWDLKLLSTDSGIAVFSTDVYDKYVGIHYDKIKEVFGINIDVEKIKELSKLDKINFSEEESNEYLKKYCDIIFSNISEDKFSVQENIAIKGATENVAVTNYSLNLSQEDLNGLIIKVLEEIKNDEELIEKIVVTSNTSNVQITVKENNSDEVISENIVPETENQENVIEEVEQENIQEGQENQEDNSEDTINNASENTVENIVEDAQENTTIESNIPVITINPVGTVSDLEVEENAEKITTQEIETTDINELMELETEKNIEDYLINILLGRRVDTTVKDFQEMIDNLITEVEKLEGNGLTINVYASEEKIEKATIILPNTNKIELEFPENSDSSNSIKVTYLYSESITDEETENTDKEENNKSNGFSLEITKTQTNASTKYVAEYNFIENESINKKIKLDIKTDGAATSKEIKNDIVITVSTSESEIQVAIDNDIKFTDSAFEISELNDENCLFLDSLNEERDSTIEDLKNRITTLYTNKKENLNFIDTNTYSSTKLENASSNVTREEAKNALITKVGNMMQEAIDRNEEFTIKNLENLKIDGYEVSSNVTEQSAIIVVDVYTFNIDTSFVLTDVE